ncbi:hypothetical protein OS188_04125 [Xanthomarina sp. F1114]|uniref:hypothetical protein n=1 Tax=Xanthomarina sp. F1114 TaxID=2996019 RepID=UPI00225E2771|nr:hypothetical protein [Xanthomarina sp. F1114]MCX7547136.1 hypothetical protein [Xanthomarina sp. F1114]
MKFFVTLIFITFLSVFQMNAQEEVGTYNTSEAFLLISLSNTDTELAAKKKDILNTKINSKLKGEVDLFFIADKSKIC